MELSVLGIDLARWDQSPGGDLLAVPFWSDVRPLRSAAGLADWRLCGNLSWWLRERRVSGTVGERLLLLTRRLPWRAVMAVGTGTSSEFSEDVFRQAVLAVFSAMKGIGMRSLAMALPGRDLGRIQPDRALTLLTELAQAHAEQAPAAVTIIDTPVALKCIAERAGIVRPPVARTPTQVAGAG